MTHKKLLELVEQTRILDGLCPSDSQAQNIVTIANKTIANEVAKEIVATLKTLVPAEEVDNADQS